MAFFKIFEPLLAILVMAGIVSQCVMPELASKPWFPIFRRNWKVRADIANAEEEISTDVLEKKLNQLRREKGNTHDAESN